MKKNDKIARSLSGIGDDLISQATGYSAKAEKKKHRMNAMTRRILLTAASLALVCTLGVTLFSLLRSGQVNNKKEPTGIVFSGDAYKTDASAELPEALKNVSVTSDGAIGKALPVSGSIVVRTSGECSTETLAQYLKVTPEIPMSVSKRSDCEFILTPAQSGFTPGAVYRVTLGNPENPAASYAFQTETKLIIKSILPGNLKTGVPVDTGIEVQFSDSVKNADFSEYIKISPKVSGSFLLYPDGRTVAFVPEQALNYDTVYKVTVKKGITGVSEKTLSEGKEIEFRTASKTETADSAYSSLYLYTDISSLSSVFSPDESAIFTFTFYGRNIASYSNAVVSLYKYKSASDAVNAIKENEASLGDGMYKGKSYPTYDLIHISDMDIDLGSSGSNKTVNLGTGLDTGIYLVKTTVKVKDNKKNEITKTVFGFIQISNLRSYSFSSDGKTLVWINKMKTGVLSGAEIDGVLYKRADGWNNEKSSAFTAFSGKTGSDGTFVYENKDNNASVIKVTDGDDYLICAISLSETDTADYYMKSVYTDREVYFSSDKINYSGYVVPVYGKELPRALYLSTGASSVSTLVPVGADGSFSGSVTIENMGKCTLWLRFADEDGNIVVSDYIRVTEEEKPVLRASMSFDKLFYSYGDTVTATLSVTFFDGTPAPGFDFSFDCNSFGTDIRKGTTDENGEIKVKIKTGMISAYSTAPQSIYVDAELSGTETQTLNISKSFLYFHSDYVFGTECSGDKRVLKLNYLDTSSLKTEDDLIYPAFPDNTVGRAASGKVSYELIKYTTIKTSETRYDSYTKRTYTNYRYSTETETVEAGTFEFRNGIIELPLKKVEGFTGGYYYKIKFYDGRQTYNYTVSATEWNYIYASSGVSYGIYTEKTAFSVGERINASFTVNGVKQKSVIFCAFANGLDSYFTGEYTGEFSEDMIAGVRLYGVYFDTDSGRFTLQSKNDISYDYEKNASVDIKLITDKAVYKPGETASLKIKAEGAENGYVLISVVDEACFALGEQDADIAKAFFSSLGSSSQSDFIKLYYGYYPYYYGGSGFKPININTMLSVGGSSDVSSYYNDSKAKPGAVDETDSAMSPETTRGDNGDSDGNGYYIRKYFADNPEFSLVALDGNGEGLLSFKVPDNLTSWRVTACSVSGTDKGLYGIRAGYAVSGIVCTQPFFINANVSPSYINGDDIVISLRSYGAGAKGGVMYEVTLCDEKGNEIQTKKASSEALSQVWVNFGKQGTGSYSFTVKAECGEYHDAVQYETAVAESGICADVRKDITASEIKDISPVLYPVTLTFYNKLGYGLYNDIVNRLKYSYDGGRADMLAARYICLVCSEKLYGTEPSDISALLKQINGYGTDYVSLLTYSEGDPLLTSELLSVYPELLSGARRAKLTELYTKVISSSSVSDESTLCASYMALAAMNEPVLTQLYGVAGIAGNFSTEAKLYLAGAFACMGDYPAAYDIYTQIKAELGVYDGEFGTLYIKGESDDETASLTSLALIASSRLSKTDAERMASFLMKNSTKAEPCALGLASYVKYYTPSSDITETGVSYTLGGEKKDAELKPGSLFTLTLTKFELAGLEIIDIGDNTGIRASYKGTAKEALSGAEISDRVKITKKITEYEKGMYLVTLDISGRSTHVYEAFDITDVIPAGARYFSMYSGGYTSGSGKLNAYAYIYNSSNQNMKGYVSVYNNYYETKNIYKYTCPEYGFNISVSYVIRGAVEGEFICENAMIENAGTGVFGLSERYTVNISDSGKWIIKAFK